MLVALSFLVAATGIASTIIPRPALLRKRLEMTGRDISLGKYFMISMGLAGIIMIVFLFVGEELLKLIGIDVNRVAAKLLTPDTCQWSSDDAHSKNEACEEDGGGAVLVEQSFAALDRRSTNPKDVTILTSGGTNVPSQPKMALLLGNQHSRLRLGMAPSMHDHHSAQRSGSAAASFRTRSAA